MPLSQPLNQSQHRSLNWEAQTLLELMERIGAPALDSQEPAMARATRAELAPEPTEDCHEIRSVDAGGVPARLYLPTPTDTLPGLLVFFHGGGWVIGDLDSHDNICRSLTNRSGQAVLSIDYRLAPEDPFPAGLGDCIQATRWAHANAAELGIDPDRLAVGGDSAGANFAAVVCARRSRSDHVPAARLPGDRLPDEYRVI